MTLHKTPKSALLEFYQARGDLTKVLFKTDEAEDFHITSPNFICKLTLPPSGRSVEQVVLGKGRTKKAAEHAAAEKGLEVIGLTGLHSSQTLVSGPTAAQESRAVGSQTQGVSVQQLSAQLESLLQASKGVQKGRDEKPEAPSGSRPDTPTTTDKRAQQAATAQVPSTENVAAVVIPEDVASLSEHEAKELLVQAKAEIKSLKEHVAEETRRKKYAAEVLLAVGNGHQQYMANESSQ